MRMKLQDIKIKKFFLESHPRPEKVIQIQNEFLCGHDIGKQIIVNNAGYLIDGYIRYLVLKESGILHADVTQNSNSKIHDPNKNNYKYIKTKYVFAKHNPMGKTYVWRIYGGTDYPDNIEVGSVVSVETKYGLQKAIVERVEELDCPPVETTVRRVRYCYKKR